MIVILKDFEYCGYHFEEYACEIPQIASLENISAEKMEEYIFESLEDTLNWNLSFMREES